MSVPEPQLDIASRIRQHALSIPGKLQMIMIAFAKALEVIPRQICDNAGLDSTDILNKLRVKHANGEKWYGVHRERINQIYLLILTRVGIRYSVRQLGALIAL